MKTWKRREGLLEKTVDGELILYDASGSRIFCLNESAGIIWRQLKEGANLESIARAVAGEFGGDDDVIRNDARVLLEDLERKSLVEVT